MGHKQHSFHPPGRGIYCNRTLNMRSIKAVGFDMDYTLIHYNAEEWERRAYEHSRKRLLDQGWPVEHLRFDPSFVTLGLIMDIERGNIVKANRFGYVKKACHGTSMMGFDAQRKEYSQVLVDLHEPRWAFMNTQFARSAACLYAQVVDLLDDGKLPPSMGYRDAYREVRSKLDETHLFSELKPEVIADPDFFVKVDPDLPLALRDLKEAGKKILLITNSGWEYTQAMMTYAFDRFLGKGTTWRSLFDLVIVSARKPHFFSTAAPVYEVVEGGLLRPYFGKLTQGGVYQGGHAGLVEETLGLGGAEILYVGDHIFADVHVSKSMLRWRTALVVRELEEELAAEGSFGAQQEKLAALMVHKSQLEHEQAQVRLKLQRLQKRYGPKATSEKTLREAMAELKTKLLAIDDEAAPLAKEASELLSPSWGLLMRAGNDKSHLARQIERHADIYTSRVSNFLFQTPFAFLRSPRGSLPHD